MEYFINLKNYLKSFIFDDEDEIEFYPINPSIYYNYKKSPKKNNKVFIFKSDIEKNDKLKKLDEEILELEKRYQNLIKDNNTDEDDNKHNNNNEGAVRVKTKILN